MDYFFSDELPSSSKAFSDFIPGIEGGAQETEDLSIGDVSHSSNMNQSSDQPSRSAVEHINRKAEELVETINVSRERDQQLMANYQDKLSEKLSERFQQLNDLLVTVYEENNKMLEVKLAELTATLTNCEQLNQELLDANEALSRLRNSF